MSSCYRCHVSYLAFLLSVFDAFLCREVGPGHSILAVNYSIDCGSTYYSSLRLFAFVLLVVWPLGLPALLFFMLWKARAGIIAEDEDITAQFDFVLGDYKTEYYYWCGGPSFCVGSRSS